MVDREVRALFELATIALQTFAGGRHVGGAKGTFALDFGGGLNSPKSLRDNAA
ncbi:hypothetical protein [Devosia sp.]|uniref:hypothetical protein n=1 Tax=Devosia sp. TaxID=1871048 RepID=UPI0019DA7AA9|nr:hypothetical protein [Devosia sp.]MBE0579966.1 hypothetical protein [Devosia sp.]